MKSIFRYQGWHLFVLILLLMSLKVFQNSQGHDMGGELWGIRSQVWFWLAVAAPVFHQIYVWLVWRLELYRHSFTTRFGLSKAFRAYAIGFSILFASRLIMIILLATSNRNSLSFEPIYAYALAALITPLVIYLFYSVKKYFTVERAYGIDHFDEDYSEPYEKRGIFKYTSNGMYVFGLMILYLPGLLLLSKLALVIALFNHLYIWVHYYCTELPDMRKIYGPALETKS